ncbi:MAG: FtsX-like permease family protein [Candidatus Heimdallarchaeota archaeon]
MSSIIEKFKLYYKMIFLNRKNTIIMFLGLGISLALISESLMFMYSFQYGSFEGFIQENPSKQISISIDSYVLTNEPVAGVLRLKEISDTAIENAQAADRVKKVDWYLERGAFTVVFDENNQRDLIQDEYHIYGIPPDYFSALEKSLYNGSIIQGVGEFLVVAKEATLLQTNISNYGRHSVYTQRFGYSYQDVVDMGIPVGGQYINVTGSLRKESFLSMNGSLADDFRAMADYFSEEFYLTSYTNFASIVKDFQYLTGYAAPTGRCVFNLEQIDAFNIPDEISLVNSLAQEFSICYQNEGYSLHVYAEIIPLLEQFSQEFLIFQLFGLLFITPIIGMALSLTSYSANIMKRTQKRQISSMIQRGSSRREMLALLIFQVIELTITAIIIALVMGFAFSWLITKSNGFLNFSGTSYFPAINMMIFYIVVAAGFILSLLINVGNIWELSQISTQDAYTEAQKKKPVWEKMYLDIVLIILGITLWLIVKIQLQGFAAYAFAYGIGTTAPVLLILGGILFATRMYPIVINQITKIKWKRPVFEVIGLSAKRSTRRQSDAIRSLILISLTFTLVFSSMITIESYSHYDEENAYYSLGADILVRGVDINSNLTKETAKAIEGISSATYVTATSQIVTYGDLTYSYMILGIDPIEFAQTAYFEKDYLIGKDPVEFFSQIVDNNDVVMQKDQLEKIDSDGVTFDMLYEKYPIGNVNRTLDIKGIYKFLPRYFVTYPDESSTVFRFNILGNYANVEEFAYAFYSIGGDMLVDVADGYDIKETAFALETKLGRSVENVRDLMGSFEGSMRNTMLYGSLNASFISSMVISVSAIVLMILIQSYENEREVVTLKVLGMSPRQLFNMFLSESMFLVIFGALIGAALGIFSATMFTDILTLDTIIPTSELRFEPLGLSISFVMLFTASIAAAALTSWIIFRKDTIKAIKQI